MAKWECGKIGMWQNGNMAKWQNGSMANVAKREYTMGIPCE
jgi:hypothetical protein